MKKLLFLLIFCISLLSYAQNGINYKALIKDDLGNVVADQGIAIKFTILEDVTNVYEETHIPTTDANGLIIVNIGDGFTIDVFTDIDWSSDDHFLNVQIDIGSGYIDMGTTQFMAVPYAIQAEKAANVTGLEAIGSGYRIVGRDPTRYGNIGFNAVDFSFSNITSTVFGATGAYSLASGYRATADGASSNALGSNTQALGDYSTAVGKDTDAFGDYATAMGNATTASGENSIATGISTEASGESSTAIGRNTIASGSYSTAMGNNTKAESRSSTAIGRFNVGGGNPTLPFSTDPLFEIGNGTSGGNRLNALTVLKNGHIGVDKSSGINAKLDIDHAGSQTSPQINIRETAGDFSRLNFSNTSSSSYWAIAGSLDGTTSTDRINFFHSAVGDIMSIRGNGDVVVGGAVVHSSDRRLKNAIETIPYGLDEVLQLSPKAYHWKSKPDQDYKSLGLIAQDVQSVIKEIVHKAEDENKTLSVSYTELIPVLIQAIKEQQIIIQEQNNKINGLTAQLEQNEDTQKLFNQRLENMEALIKLDNQ